MTLTDTGPLVALVDVGEKMHHQCTARLPQLSPPLVSTWPCFTEAMYLLGKSGGYPLQKALWRLYLSGVLAIHEQNTLDADKMRVLMDQYRDAPMDLADASLVAAAETLGAQTLFTLDKHFYAYRLPNEQAFHVVP